MCQCPCCQLQSMATRKRTVEDGAGINISIELSLSIGEKREIQFLLLRTKVITADYDSPRRQAKVICAFQLERV